MARPYQVKIYDVTYTTLAATVSDGDYMAGGEVVTELSGQETFSFFLNINSSSYIVAEIGKVVELYNTVRAAIYKAYRIVKINPVDDGRIYKVEIICESLKYDLNKRRFNFSGTIIGQTPTVHLTEILTDSDWAVGTVTPTAAITVQYENDSVLEALEKVRQASGVQGVLYDLDFRTKPYYVDLKTVGDQSSTSTIAYGKNIEAITGWENTIPNGTRIFPIGGAGSDGLPMTIARHTHRVTAIDGDAHTMDSDKIVSSDGDWTSYEIENVDTGFNTTLSDANKQIGGNDILHFSGGFTVGQRLRILDGLKYIRDAVAIATYGERDIVLRDENFTDVINLVGPGASSAFSGTYTSGLCEGWTKVGLPTVAANTDAAYLFNGTKSQHVTVSTFTVTPSAPTVTVQSSMAGEVNGAVNYKIAWVTSDGEGPLSSATSAAPTNDAVLVEYNQAVPDSRILFWRIYRTKAGGSIYYLIAENSTVATGFYDTLADSLLTIQPAATNTAAGGQGIKRTFATEVGKEYAAVVYLHLISGRVRVELANGEFNVFPPVSMDDAKRGSPSGQTGGWIINLQALVADDTTGEIRILAHQGVAEFYAGAVMVVQSPYAPPSDHFVSDNGATELWYRAYDELQKEKVAKLKVSCRIKDFYEVGIGSDVFNVGDKVAITHSPLGLSATLRILRKSFSFLEPQKCDIDVDNQPERYIGEFALRRQTEKRLSAAAGRQYSQVDNTLRQLIATAGEASVEFRKII